MSVYLVGAGPGAGDLLTLRALRLLERADAVVHDRLVGPEVLSLIAPRAERIDVGKSPGAGGDQARINELLVELASHHEVVVRLKGGDPFVFGRGGEEARFLAARGIPVVVVPGVSSAFAAPALAGVAVTHRGLAQGVCVVTALAESGADVDFTALALPQLTLVILMGVAQRARISAQLQAGGLDPLTPTAVVHAASTPRQRVVRSALRDLACLDVAAPAVIVVGPVAELELGLSEVIEELVASG